MSRIQVTSTRLFCFRVLCVLSPCLSAYLPVCLPVVPVSNSVHLVILSVSLLFSRCLPSPPCRSQKKGALIDSSKHRVITCAHPSPLSATRKPDPFIGSECFKKANDALEELGHGGVDWNVL